MSGLLQHLLRLPPPLRQVSLARSSTLLDCPRCLPRLKRPYTTSPRFEIRSRGESSQKAPPPPPPKQHIPPPAKKHRPDPPITKRDSKFKTSAIEYAKQILGRDGQHMTIYRAPSHNSFTLLAYIMGAVFIFGGWQTADNTKPHAPTLDDKQATKPPQIPFWIRATVMVCAASFAIIGTVVTLSPSRLLRSISLVRATPTSTSTNTTPYMRLELGAKFPVPFTRVGNSTLDVPIDKVAMDRGVPSSGALQLTNIPIADAAAFTADPRFGTATRRSFNPFSGWATNTKRFLVRDGFTYMQVDGAGTWKMDLKGARVLMNGAPMAALLRQEPGMERGLVGFLRGKQGWFGLLRSATGNR